MTHLTDDSEGMMKFNVNNPVRVRLTPLGHELIVKNHKALFGAQADKYPIRTVKDDDGWSEWQLWDLMAEFGPHLRMGFSVPFETEIEIVDPEQ